MKWSGLFGFCFYFCFWHYARNLSILGDCLWHNYCISVNVSLFNVVGGYLYKCQKSIAFSCYLGLALFSSSFFSISSLPPCVSASVPPSVLLFLTCFPFLASSSIAHLSGTYSTVLSLLRVPENTNLEIKYIKTL